MSPSALRLVSSAVLALAPVILTMDMNTENGGLLSQQGQSDNTNDQGTATWNNHSLCYNYFLNKDKCVHGSLTDPCKGDGGYNNSSAAPSYSSEGQTIFRLTSIVQVGVEAVIETNQPSIHKRYDTFQPVEYVAGGLGICGNYDTNATAGACIWSGSNFTDGSDPAQAGWINGAFNQTCGRHLYIQRQGKPDTVQYMPILDGCNFNTHAPEVGCFQIYLTEAAFAKFATPEEMSNGHLDGVMSWDFLNLDGKHPKDAPN